jgi:hypothetical protein
MGAAWFSGITMESKPFSETLQIFETVPAAETLVKRD